MNTSFVISELKRNKDVFSNILKNLDPELIYWKQAPEKWSLLEIVCHLYDEEREDFRARLIKTLDSPGEKLDPINPAAWVSLRNYKNEDFNKKLSDFLAERDNSIKYLLNLKNPNWENFYEHPKFGKMSSKLFFTNWLAHDYLHIRQILKLKYDYLSSINNENLKYAGEW